MIKVFRFTHKFEDRMYKSRVGTELSRKSRSARLRPNTSAEENAYYWK